VTLGFASVVPPALAAQGATSAHAVVLPQTSALATGAGTRLWSYTNPPEGWVAWIVSIGNSGTEALSQFGPYADYTRMFSGYSGPGVAPAWQVQESVPTQRHRVDSADDLDVHVSMYDKPEPSSTTGMRRVILRKFRSSDPSGAWTYTWPVLSNGHDRFWPKISRDGQTIVALVHNINTGLEDLSVFGPNSSVPLRSFSYSTLGPAKAFNLSADGRVAVIAGDIKYVLVDTLTGATLHSAILFSQTYLGHGLSGNGSIYAFGSNNTVSIVRRNPTSGVYSLAYTHNVAGANYCNHLDVSENGATCALAFNFTDDWNKVVIQALDLATYATTMSETVIGSGALQNVCSSVSASSDGSRFAVGLWGDQNGLSPEIRVYNRNQSTPLWTYDLPGSVNALDLSSDGRRLAVASKAIHANILGGGGQVDLFQVEDEDLVVDGVPRAGSSVNVTVRGTPGTPAILLLAPSLAAQPIVFPTLGTLYLSRTSLSTMAMGTVNPLGTASVSLPISSTPGATVYLQGYSSSPRRLGRTYLKLTAIP